MAFEYNQSNSHTQVSSGISWSANICMHASSSYDWLGWFSSTFDCGLLLLNLKGNKTKNIEHEWVIHILQLQSFYAWFPISACKRTSIGSEERHHCCWCNCELLWRGVSRGTTPPSWLNKVCAIQKHIPGRPPLPILPPPTLPLCNLSKISQHYKHVNL